MKCCVFAQAPARSRFNVPTIHYSKNAKCLNVANALRLDCERIPDAAYVVGFLQYVGNLNLYGEGVVCSMADAEYVGLLLYFVG